MNNKASTRLKKLFDGWSNILTGLGGKKDTANSTKFNMGMFHSMLHDELNALYTQNWIAAKGVDIPIDDALKDGREFQYKDEDTLKEFQECLKKYDIDGKISKLFKWSKVFGSACLVIVSDDDEMDKPFVLEYFKKGQLKNIAIVDRFDIETVQIERDPLINRYLKPKSYRINKSSQEIHHSRVIQIDGIETTNRNRDLLNGFGLSLYEKTIPEIRNATVSPQLIINLLSQSNLDVYGIAGLNDALTDGNDDLVMMRLQAVQQGKSIFNGIALDKDDSYTNVSKNFSGIRDIHTEFYQVVCGAFDIPYTRFMGATSTGLNATGAGDLKNYYDKVLSEQKNIKAVYDKLDKIIQIHLFGYELEGYSSEFPSLFQMDDEQTSIIKNRDATTKEIYLRNGIIDEIEAKASLVNDPMFPTITSDSFSLEVELKEEMNNIVLNDPE